LQVLAVLLVLLALPTAWTLVGSLHGVVRSLRELGVELVPDRAALQAPAAVTATEPRADRDLQRGAHTRVAGGVLYVPPGLRSADGRFDLLIHFHGNTELIEQSAAAAGLPALVLVVNLGDGARRYMDALASPMVFDKLVEQSQEGAEALGLRRAEVRRIALSAWSAGYAGIRQILRERAELIDTVLLMDGLHAPFADRKKHEVARSHLAPFLRFSERAAAGERLFVITHSAIETYTYASAAQTAEVVVADNALERKRVERPLAPVTFDAARRATPSHGPRDLLLASEATREGLRVYGFAGDRAEHHIAHLVNMSLTVLPPLVARWQE
jgi:hypothetical protein